MNWNIIKVDYGWPLTKIEEPLIGSTITLSVFLGLGLYDPDTNIGYLLTKMSYEAGNARDLLFPELDGNVHGNPADYHVLLSGLRCLRQPERGRLYEEAVQMDAQIDAALAELGFDKEKIRRRYCGKRSLEAIDDYFTEDDELLERGEIVIDTQRRLAEIRISDDILPGYSVYHRVAGIGSG